MKDSDQEKEEDEERSGDKVCFVWRESVWSGGGAVRALAYDFPQPLNDLDQEEEDKEKSGDKVCLCVGGCVV